MLQNNIQDKHFITIDSKNKIRYIRLSLFTDDQHATFEIRRTSGLRLGALIQQPTITVTAGKSSRTAEQQAILQYNHLVTKCLDRGYIQVDSDPNTLSEQEINKLLPAVKTDQQGFRKHMLAKAVTSVNDSVIESGGSWYVSRKIDGVRCSLYFDGTSIKSASRGGKDYDKITEHLRTNPVLVEFFKKHPTVVLDGELYKHGQSLQQISGVARTQKNDPNFLLEYYIYDVQEDAPFSLRLQDLESYQSDLGITGFDPYKQYKEGDLMIQFVPHELVGGENKLAKIWRLHDLYVSEGWEGCVARVSDGLYKYGGRSNEMIKFKNYQDSEFEIVGLEPGLRGVEDMVFKLKTASGSEFKAKPCGSLETKQWYAQHESDLLGKRATCKFFYYSDDGIPLQPVAIAVRDYE